MFPGGEIFPDGGTTDAGAAEVLAELGGLLIRLRRRDLSLTAEVVLVYLERSGAARVGHLAALAGVSQPSMTELLGRLGRDGLIARQAHPGDRAVSVSISDLGRDLLRRRRAETHDRLVALVRSLDPVEQAALAGATSALNHLLAAAAPDRAER